MQEEMGFCWEEYGGTPPDRTGKIYAKHFSLSPQIGNLFEDDWYSLWGISIFVFNKFTITLQFINLEWLWRANGTQR